MQPFFALNGLENDHPLPLIYYFRSFGLRNVRPPEDAKAAIERAAMLAPFDHSVAMDAAFMLAQEGKIELARYLLGPVAANPHGTGMASFAQAIIDAMETAPEGTPFNISTVARPIETEEEDAEE